MHSQAIEQAANQLVRMRNEGASAADLGPDGPESIEDGLAVQDAVVAKLGEPVAGYKVSGREPEDVMRGTILKSRMLQSGTRIDPREALMLGIEVEIAYRFERDFVLTDGPFDYEKLAKSVVALPTIEVVASRFNDYSSAPLLHRLADMMSNGFLVTGDERADWRQFDLTNIEVSLHFDGQEICKRNGGHSSGDPLLMALAFINSTRVEKVTAGQIITTGTFTGVEIARPGMKIEAAFDGFGGVSFQIGQL